MLSRFILSSLVCISAANLMAEEATDVSCRRGPKPYRVTTTHIEGNGIGYKKGYTSLDGFFAWDKGDNFVPFLDLRGHVFNDGRLAANAGLGGRYLVNSMARSFGANVYYDYRNTTHQHYNQVGAGLESLGTHWDFRINGYFPVGRRTSHYFHTRFDRFKGNNILIQRKKEFDMVGFDSEVGYHIKAWRNYPIYAAAGPYYISGRFGQHSWGGETRLSVAWKDYIKLQGSFSYDSIFRDIWQGQISFSLPFGKGHKLKKGNERYNRSCNEAYLARETLLQDVYRKEIIVADRHKKREKAINPATGAPYFVLFVDNTSHSAGTYNSPYPTLAAAEAASSPNDIIYVFPGDGTSNGMNAGILLQDSQRLLGASQAYSLPTSVGSIKIPALASTMPLITNTAGDVVVIANNNTISGLYIQNLSGSGISQPNTGTSVSNLTVTNNTIQGSGIGINVNNLGGGSLIRNNIITEESNYGIVFVNTSINDASYVIQNNTVGSSSSAFNFVYTDCSGTSTTLTGNQLLGATYGVQGTLINTTLANANTLNVSNNNIISEYLYDVTLQNDASANLLFTNNVGQGYGGTYVVLQNNSQANLTFNDNTFNTTYGEAVISASDASQLTGSFSGNTMISNYTENFSLTLNGTSTATFNIDNNNMQNTPYTDYGIQIAAADNTVGDFNISGNSMSSSYSGISIAGSSASQLSANINRNTIFNSTDVAIDLSTTGTSQGTWHVTNNTLTGNATEVSVTSSGGTTCLRFVGNTAFPTPNAFTFAQTGGTFNLEPLYGNSGQIVQTGTITNVPAGTCQ